MKLSDERLFSLKDEHNPRVLLLAEYSIASPTRELMQWKDDVWQIPSKAFGSQDGYKTSSSEVTGALSSDQ